MLAWDPALDPEDILHNWIRLTFGLDRKIIDTITDMSMKSWPAYENYTGNLGVQTLSDILYTHFGVRIAFSFCHSTPPSKSIIQILSILSTLVLYETASSRRIAASNARFAHYQRPRLGCKCAHDSS